jgi:hypothetical protein
MKGMDATVLRICETFNLKTAALPVYECEEHYNDEDPSDIRDLVDSASSPFDLFGKNANTNHQAERDRDGNVDWIGRTFVPMHEDDCGDYYSGEGWLTRLQQSSSFSPYHGIQWLNGPKHWETNMATLHVRSLWKSP